MFTYVWYDSIRLGNQTHRKGKQMSQETTSKPEAKTTKTCEKCGAEITRGMLILNPKTKICVDCRLLDSQENPTPPWSFNEITYR